MDPQLIQELFDKDPLKLTHADLDVIIGEFRAGRMHYLNPVDAEGKPAPKAKKGAKKAVVPLDIMDLEELLGTMPKKGE